jgi:ribose transport system substrate-binding protein
MPVGGWAQLYPAAYKEVTGRYKTRLAGKQTLILSADTLPSQMELLAQGLSHANVGQRPFEMGYQSVMTLNTLKQGKKVADPLYTGLDTCTPATTQTCIKK